MKIIKNSQTERSLLTECGADEPIFLSDVYKKHTQAKKYQSAVLQCGRSMVEMLGVLAIIGVLSVGAVAGYSKAMFKHKMNKTMDTISHAVTRVAELDTMNLGGEIYHNVDAIKYGIIPDCDVNHVDIEGETGTYCPLPLGEIGVDFDSSLYTYKTPLFGQLYIRFTQEPFESCVAFFNSGIYKNVPEEWWSPAWEGSYNQVTSTGGTITVDGQSIYGKSEYWL